jgi:hypothetical protein
MSVVPGREGLVQRRACWVPVSGQDTALASAGPHCTPG